MASVVKSKRPAVVSSPSSQSTRSSTKKSKSTCFVCPICDESIKDSSTRVSGQDSVFCDGVCNTWLHRRCAGLSKMLFVALSHSKDPFYCPHCRLHLLSKELSSLRMDFDALSSKLVELQECVSNSDAKLTTVNGSDSGSPPAVKDPCQNFLSRVQSKVAAPSPPSNDRKFNLEKNPLRYSKAS